MNEIRLIKHPEMYATLQHLFLMIQSTLKNNLSGVYIGGSIANDCFDPLTSDIDCYILTKNNISKDLVAQIQSMHKHFYMNKHAYAQKIEASYIPINDLTNFNSNNTRPYFNEGQFYMAQYGNNFKIELFILREKGITLFGPNVNQFIPSITEKELKEAIQRNLEEYWASTLQNAIKFVEDDYQVFAILTMCRTLYSMQTGKITSKNEAARWVMHHLPGNWNKLIEHAMVWKPATSFSKPDETRQFVEFVLNECK